jgi:formylglycine-generating enzyme required for sulfatase activity
MNAINPALQFVNTVGVLGLVNGVQTGMVAAPQAFAAASAVGTAIDVYAKARAQEHFLEDLRGTLGSLPSHAVAFPKEVLEMLAVHAEQADIAVKFAAAIDGMGQMAANGAAVAANLEAPYDLGAQWRWIPAGEFRMGSAGDDPHRCDDEKFLETVMTGGFFMLDHPVTNAEFRAFLEAAGREDARDLNLEFAGDLQPAVRVTHEEATEYSAWIGKRIAKRMGVQVMGRLPLEEEWEKAAKGPKGNEFISPATHEQAHFDAKVTRGINHPHAYANGYGLKDMIGNVWEWTSSRWDESSCLCVVRGASWDDDVPRGLRAASRIFYGPDDRGYGIGFRPVLVPQDSGK